MNHNELMSKRHKIICTASNYIEHLLILAPANTGWVSISAFGSLVGIPIGIVSSAVKFKICAITTEIKKV